MTFLHPLALLGLAAAAIPALLHLLQRRTPPELEFPPLRYLSEAERQSARRLRLRHLLLLILRTALIIAIVIAAARPLVRIRGGTAGGAHEPTALVVILDNSLSSGAVVDGRPVLDRLRVAARSSLARAGGADRVWLMLADGVIRSGSREMLLHAAESTSVGWQRLDLVDAVERAGRLVQAEPLPGREVHVLSDGQRTALAAGHADVPSGVRVLSLTPPNRVATNRGIASVRVSEGSAVVAVTGSGDASAVPVTVRARPSGASVRGLVTPGSALTVTLPPQTASPGWWTGEAVLEPDELRGDDRRLFAWRVAPPAAVSAGPGAGPFVEAALAVLRAAHRVADGRDVLIGDRPGATRSIVQPPADAALVGQANRALAARGVPWRWVLTGTPGPIVSATFEAINGTQVTRRYRMQATGSAGDDSAGVLATVNNEAWLVRSGTTVMIGSRLDTAWTALPTTPGFVPLIDALVNRIAAGETEVDEAEGTSRIEFHTRGADTIGVSVYGSDARESDLTPASVAEALAALGGRARVELVEEARFAAAGFAGTRRADASGMLLLFALLLAFVELGVATRTH